MLRAVEEWTADCPKAGMCDELESYLDANLEATTDVVGWWGVSTPFLSWIVVLILVQTHSSQYPILAWIARDYLPIQGSATPSERAFSNASLTDSKQRNRLTPEIFEALQILKSAYRNGHMSAPAEAERYYQIVMSALGGENGDEDGPASSFL